MRTIHAAALAATFVSGALLAGCSKPEPAAGAPSPDAVTIDSAKTTADSGAKTAMPDSMMKDSTKMDSTMSAAKDTAAAVVPDTAKKN